MRAIRELIETAKDLVLEVMIFLAQRAIEKRGSEEDLNRIVRLMKQRSGRQVKRMEAFQARQLRMMKTGKI